MNVISVNHKYAPINVRNRIAFNREDALEFCNKRRCVVLSTCNRTEIYFNTDITAMQRAVADFKSLDSSIMNYYRVYQGNHAITHLYYVACGINSMILGEDEILRQVKDALSLAQSVGASDYELNTVFKGAISCAKKIKTVTKLSTTAVSVGTLTANEVFSRPHDCVLVIGASGKAGGIVMKNLLSKGINIVATVRNHNALFDYTSLYPNVKFVDYHQRYAYVDTCDAIVSATSSPHYTITKDRLLPCLKTLKPRLYIDLAVPQDIDPSVAELPNTTLKDIDYFNVLSKQNNLAKLEEVEKAKLIVAEEVETLLKELSFHEFMPCLPQLDNYIKQNGVKTLLIKLKSQSDSQTFESMLKYLKELM